MEQIYELANEIYKKVKEILKQLWHLCKSKDFEQLKKSNKCSSFGTFAGLIK